jgi:DNA-binding transcriptional regulator YbjK
LNWKKLPKVLLLSGGAALVGWWCFHAAAGEALAVRNPTAAAAIVPDDPRVALGLARMEFRLKQGEGDPAVMRRATEALAEVPLASEPFFFAGLAALSARDEAKGQQLVLEARRRAPRDSVARIVALDGLLRARRVAEAVAEIAVISQLLPESTQVLIPELAKFARNPGTRATLAEVLRKNPRMQNQMLEHLAGNGTDPETVLAIAPPIAPGQEAPEWQRRLLQGVVDKGDMSRARICGRGSPAWIRPSWRAVSMIRVSRACPARRRSTGSSVRQRRALPNQRVRRHSKSNITAGPMPSSPANC